MSLSDSVRAAGDLMDTDLEADPDAGPLDVWILVERHTLLLDLAGAAEALRLANQALRRRGEPEAFKLRYCAASDSTFGL